MLILKLLIAKKAIKSFNISTHLSCKTTITYITLKWSLFSMTSIMNLQSRMAGECFETNAASSAASDS